MKVRHVLVLFVMLLLPVAVHAEFWASAKSKSYHLKSCRWVAQITPEYRVKFATREAAWQAGYRPCEVCRPPGFAVAPKQKRLAKKMEQAR